MFLTVTMIAKYKSREMCISLSSCDGRHCFLSQRQDVIISAVHYQQRTNYNNCFLKQA